MVVTALVMPGLSGIDVLDRSSTPNEKTRAAHNFAWNRPRNPAGPARNRLLTRQTPNCRDSRRANPFDRS
jgi:hypothetical protein